MTQSPSCAFESCEGYGSGRPGLRPTAAILGHQEDLVHSAFCIVLGLRCRMYGNETKWLRRLTANDKRYYDVVVMLQCGPGPLISEYWQIHLDLPGW